MNLINEQLAFHCKMLRRGLLCSQMKSELSDLNYVEICELLIDNKLERNILMTHCLCVDAAEGVADESASQRSQKFELVLNADEQKTIFSLAHQSLAFVLKCFPMLVFDLFHYFNKEIETFRH